jgi:hypothetical protein
MNSLASTRLVALLHRETAKRMRASGYSRSSTTFASSSGKRASRRRRPIMVLVAHRTNPLPPHPWKGATRLHGQWLNVVRGVEEARWVPLREREAEEAEVVPGVHELGPRASASGVSLPVVVVRSKMRNDRTRARVARRHPHLAEQHPVHGRDLSEEEQQGCNTSRTMYGMRMP